MPDTPTKHLDAAIERLRALYANAGHGGEWLYSEGGQTIDDEKFAEAIIEQGMEIITSQQVEIVELKRRLEIAYNAFSALECEGYGEWPVLERGIKATIIHHPFEE